MRVKYFSNYDLSIGYYLELAERVICAYIPDRFDEDINDIIEYYNIAQFFDQSLFLKSWDERTIKSYSDTVKQFRAKIGRYFHNVKAKEFGSLYDQVDPEY